jgi:hypothetical protein
MFIGKYPQASLITLTLALCHVYFEGCATLLWQSSVPCLLGFSQGLRPCTARSNKSNEFPYGSGFKIINHNPFKLNSTLDCVPLSSTIKSSCLSEISILQVHPWTLYPRSSNSNQNKSHGVLVTLLHRAVAATFARMRTVADQLPCFSTRAQKTFKQGAASMHC